MRAAGIEVPLEHRPVPAAGPARPHGLEQGARRIGQGQGGGLQPCQDDVVHAVEAVAGTPVLRGMVCSKFGVCVFDL